ncbi:uncharacterized protein LOC112569287 isoform X2 [Pomacea canaliculata]|uniref:uncharacterized protein LOC112569287 isoform X2 n=1 Tax=Pomacea canaliculata TaxID=400727 RepID=UPI000D72F8D9|nr:uncharacterized protein LOC112569287 isoform X2 [Pomacea canaliculata]
MLCQADGRPTPRMSFVSIKDNRVVNSKPLGNIQVTEVRQELRYLINQIQCEDSGDYRCEVDNGIGHDNQTVRLLVLCAPRRTKSQAQVPLLDVDISSGPLTLEIMGYPTPFVAGTTFHAEVLNDRSKIVPVENTLNVTCHANTSSPALVTCKVTVVNLTQVTQGFYTTVFKNSFGQLAFPFKINRKAGLLPARVVSGVGWEGRLEILANGFWSTVCDDDFGKEEAQVACRMLGYRSLEAVFVGSSVYGAGQGSIILDDLRCSGTEASLTQCIHSGLYTHDCNPSEDIGVICSNGTSQVRLTGKRRTSLNMGQANLLINGEWSMLCDISETTAKVICRQAGYPSIEAKVVDASSFGPFQGRFLNAVLNCVGNETNIFSCLTSVYGYINSCPTQQGAGVICSNSNQALYIVVASSSAANSYPLIQGTNVILKCERTRRDQMITNFTWPETAGGRSFGEYLTFDNVTREHNGRRVKCEGSYLSSGVRHSTVSEILVLQTYYYPVIRVTSKDNACQPVHDFPNHCTVTEGDNFTLQCEADSNPPPATITWSGKVSSSNGRLSFVSANRSQHGGEYMCTVVTESRTDDTRLPLRSSHRLTVLIKYPSTVLRFQLNALNNKTVTVAENSSIEMLCQADGRPTPRMSFVSIKDNNRVLNSKPLGNIQVTEVRQELRHVINQIQCENSGDYRCEVNNGIGQDNQTVRLLVLCAPRRTMSQEQVPLLDVDISSGPLTLEILGYPTPFVAGTTFRGEVLDDRIKGVPVENTLNVTCHANMSSPSLVTCNVSIVNLTQVTQGFYTTVFKNSFGELAYLFKINRKETGTKDKKSSLLVGAITGGTCAAVVVVLVIIIFIVVTVHRKLKEQETIYDSLNLRRRCEESPYAKPSVKKGEAIEVFTLGDAVSTETDDEYGTITQLQKSPMYENVDIVRK